MLVIIRSGRLAEIKWSVCTSKSLESLCVSFSRTDVELRIYHLFVWSNFNFLHNSLWITLPTQSCQVFCPFCVTLLHSLLMGLIVSSLLLHNQHLQLLLLLLLLYSLRLLADGLSLEIKWQQVCLGHHEYSGWSQEYCSLDGLDSFSDFILCKPPFQAFGDRSKYANYNWYSSSTAFLVLWQDPSTRVSFRFILFSSFALTGRQSPIYG